jgi:hypothetical protein
MLHARRRVWQHDRMDVSIYVFPAATSYTATVVSAERCRNEEGTASPQTQQVASTATLPDQDTRFLLPMAGQAGTIDVGIAYERR